ncbi:MAG: ribonuclease activity regulator RraA [Alphaproteobacteria bacterium]|jgi:regulator of RNase E activity RraA|nr:ribonuclease activity regulator RraA [Rhodospirillaceae bacterium]MDP6020766.1 ribonuclease activity regulator RraA [Alphaproteobacteria bacterium]MDP6257036.1 ribonuclease activity regulator RraA [Alphaproteobacteria bacterium]MDP7056419.1 ribonuclease activity regulator RraA [Alphaproteobacteria bacterium]MDP7230213.1 ribonuclease activity regulator RraA [Alphaproteobacteria bacterium]|tara:strand:- start:3457 stop:4200 length:744 start_codon:yes stop_codon:yes gene_type:complete
MAVAKKPKRVSKAVINKLKRVTTPTITTQLMSNHGLKNVSLRKVLPVDPGLGAFAGPAYTLRYIPLREDLHAKQYLDHPENLMTPAVEEIPAGSVMVMDANGRNDVGILGGNILMRLKMRKIAGAVTDGGMRDIPEIAELRLPVCCDSAAPPPSFTKLMLVEIQGPISCGGVPIYPGDIIVGDSEGTVAVPAEFAASVAKGGLAQDHIEGWINKQLAKGQPMPGLYPPSPKVRAAYERWVAAGEPDD